MKPASERSLGFIGGGRVASILLGGWGRAGSPPAQVVVADPSGEALARLRARCPGIETTGDVRRAAAQDLVLLAVHPPAMKGVLEQVRPVLKTDAVLVSLAPKFTIAALSGMLGGFRRIARMIPNAPSIIGRGYNPIALDASLAGEKAFLLDLFSPLGRSPEVPEEHLEAYAIVSAMGPTYFWPQLEALRSLAESFGLPPGAAREAIGATVLGAAETLADSGLTAEDVEDLIPVKPLAEEMAGLVAAYRTKLAALLEKIRP